MSLAFFFFFFFFLVMCVSMKKDQVELKSPGWLADSLTHEGVENSFTN